ncbi:MAG: hypothetical protein CMP48_22225 [Rickettsiales bacterium]|nr:hypothetical protein [Rickettsiales bacterium]
MGAELNNIPQLEGWVNLTEAAEMLGITRQHAFKKARQANEGHPSGWITVRRVGSKPMYVISTAEIADLQAARADKTDLLLGTLSRADRELRLKNHRMPESTPDDEILMAMGAGIN